MTVPQSSQADYDMNRVDCYVHSAALWYSHVKYFCCYPDDYMSDSLFLLHSSAVVSIVATQQGVSMIPGGSLCGVCMFCPCVPVGSITVLRFPPIVQRYAC